MPKLSKLTNRLRLSKKDVLGMDNLLVEAKTGILENIAAFFSTQAKNVGLVKSFAVEPMEPEMAAPTPVQLDTAGEPGAGTASGGDEIAGGSKVEQLLAHQTEVLLSIKKQLEGQTEQNKEAKEDAQKEAEHQQEISLEQYRMKDGKFVKERSAGGMGPEQWMKDISSFVKKLGAVLFGIEAAVMAAGYALSKFSDGLIAHLDEVIKFIDTILHPGKVIDEEKKKQKATQVAQAEQAHIKDLETKAAAGDEGAKKELGEKYTPEKRAAIDKEASKKYLQGLNINVPENIPGLYAPSGDKRLTQVHARLGDRENQPSWVQKYTNLFGHGQEHAEVGKNITLAASANKNLLHSVHSFMGSGSQEPASPEQVTTEDWDMSKGVQQVAEATKQNLQSSAAGMAAAGPPGRPNEGMHLSAQGYKDLFRAENATFKPYPYMDSQNRPAIGYGTQMTPNLIKQYGLPEDKNKKAINKDEAIKLAKQNVAEVEHSIYKNVKQPLNQDQFDALVDLGYNAGPQELEEQGSEGVIGLINRGKFSAAAKRLPHHWITAKGSKTPVEGLIARRKEEAGKLYNEPTSLQASLSAPSPSRGVEMVAMSTENSLAAKASPTMISAPTINAPKTNIANNSNTTVSPVDASNPEDTYVWSQRQNIGGGL